MKSAFLVFSASLLLLGICHAKELPFELQTGTKLGFSGTVLQVVPGAGILVSVSEVRFRSPYGIVPLTDRLVPASLQLVLIREYSEEPALIDRPIKFDAEYTGTSTYEAAGGRNQEIRAFKYKAK